MNVALVGATGYVGSAILEELLSRGHNVTAICRHPEKTKIPDRERLRKVSADVNNSQALAESFRGQDAVIHAFAPERGEIAQRIEAHRKGTESILAAMKAAGVGRILAVGGAGTLEVAPGVRNMDQADFPKEWEGGAKATAGVKAVLQGQAEVLWTFLSPSHDLFPGERTGKFRLGKDQLLRGPDGKSRISVQDYAVAMVDELENPQHTGHRFTVGY
jgi:hypothetical protein